MSCSEVKKIVLRTLVVALVLVMPWAGALATDVSDWAGIVNAYNGWQSTEFTLMEDVAADYVIEVPSWHAITIMLNDHTLTPPDGYDSAFSGEKAVTYVVDDAAEFANAAADPGSSTIRLAGDITLTDSVVLKNAQTIDAGPYTLTLDAGVEIGAEVSTYDEFKRAMNNAAVSVVRLTKNIEAGGWDTYSNISKMDANGFSLTGDARLTFDVSTQDELALALAQPATNKVVLQSNIRLTRKVEVAGLGKVDLNNHNLTRAANGGLVVGVWQEYDITNAMAADYVYGVKLYDDITLNSQVNVDSLDQVDENGYTLSFSGNGKIALNVSNEQELRAALANPDIKYINMTNDIRLQRELVIGSNTAHVITNGYKLTGAKVRCNVDSWEALRSACALGLPGAEITLTRNITAGEGSLNITADTVIDLHNYNITTGTETIFNVQGGKLTVKDTTRQQYPFGGSGRSYTTGDASKICNESSISNGNLIYYVTHSDPAAANGYANAGTTETLRRYSVSLNAVGLIDARKSTSPIFRVHSGAELEVSGGAYFGSKNRAIYSEGDVYLVGDTVFAGNSTTTESERDGGAIYMRNGELHLGNYESSMSHGVVVTGNHVEDGCSGGGIYIHESAVMNMEDGYITNNWCGTSTDDGGWSGGGGIAVLGVLKMSEGQVTANRAVGGGGIKTMINTDWNEGGNLLMTGGYVAANVATTYEGGGITINHSGYGKITGGYITNNETQTRQHWGGGGIFISDYGYMEMEAVFVVDNEAGGYGGGIAGCSTGRIDTHDPSDNLVHSAAIFENFAAGQHMSGTESTKDIDRIYAFTDPVFNRENGAHYQDYFCALSSYICGGMLGNGTADWSGTIDGEPIYQGTIKKTDVIVGVSITGLTSHPTKQDKNNALRAARVYISGNESYTHGGGVLCNGYLVIGHDDRHATIGDRMSVSGWKEAEGFSLKANEFGFYLVQDMNGNREPDELYFTDLDAERYGRPFMTTATNDADGLVDFAHRIPFSEEGTFYYLVGEMKGNTAGVTYDDTIYLITVTVERDVLTVVETPDGGKHDIIAEPKTVYFYRIDKVELAKKESGASSFGESGVVFNEESGANTSVDLVDLFTFVNTKTVVEYVDIEVTKKWVDSDNQDGIRPEKITVQLLADGEVVEGKTATLTGTGNEWTYTFEDLPKHVAGTKTEITYTIEEIGEVVGYTTAYSADTLTITNTHEIDETEITVTKKWVDNGNQDGLRPEKIMVQLLADGVEVEGKTAELTGEGNEWTYTFTNLPKMADGEEIVYTVKELGEIVGYTTAYSADTLTITNTHETEDTEITVTKKWVDNDNQDGLRPEKITVQLLADGVEVEGKTAELTGEGNEWTYTFTSLPKMADGAEIVYTVKELGEIVGYTTAYSADTLTITNTHETDETEITVTKKWVDNGNQDGLRPEKITVQLLADGVEVEGKTAELTGEGNEWTYTFTNLPKMADGTEIVYTVKELGEVVGYTTAYSADTLTITNTHETEDTEITVTKKWVDNGNQDGLRPEKIMVQLLADGVEVEGKTAELTGEGNEWTYTFSNLPKKANGVDIVYTVKEIGEIVGYTTAYSADTLTITNTHETETVSLSVEKVWDDSDNIAGLRSKSITVQLMADGQPVAGQTIALNKDNSWKGGWTELDKFAAGKTIAYSVEEVTVPDGYTSKVEMTEPVPGHFQVKITNTYSVDKTQITVTKKWVDGNNYDGIRPRSITVQLVADGVPVEGKTAVMTGVGNEWTLTFSDLPKYAEGKEGQLIQYTVKELGEIVGYTTAYSDDTLTLTNTHELFKRYVLEVEKVDAANPDKKLAGAKFTVYADAACTEELGVITTGADGKGQMGNLLAGAYYLVETTVPAGYQLDSTVHEVVLGADDAKTVTVKLVNHALIGSLTLKKTVVGSTSSNWSFDFDIELTIDTGDKLAGAYNATLNGMATTVVFTETDNGAKATVTLKDGDTLTILGLRTGTEYTVTEQPGEFFTTTVNSEATNKASGEIAENTVSVVAFQNKLELTDFSVKKEWHGLDAGENTPEISLTLYCNGEVYTTVTPKPTVGGLYIYENLPTMVNGVKAVYSVVEQPVDGFTTTYINAGDNEAETDCAYNGGTIINSKIPQTGDNAHLLLWMGMLMLAAIGLIGMVERIRRSEL